MLVSKNFNCRVYVVWAILYMCPTSQLSIGFPLLLFAWTITEIIRYSMYAVSLVGNPPFFLTWLRFYILTLITLFKISLTDTHFSSLPILLECLVNSFACMLLFCKLCNKIFCLSSCLICSMSPSAFHSSFWGSCWPTSLSSLPCTSTCLDKEKKFLE